MATATDWRRRLTAPTIDDASWTGRAPDRLAVVTTESGTSQAWAWDLATGERRQASSEGVGAEEAHLTPDGAGVVWWLDRQGNERGRWMVSPFEGGDPRPLFPGLADMWMSGLSLVGDDVAAGFSSDDDYLVVTRRGSEPARELYRHEQPAGVGQDWPQGPGGLSADARLLAIWQSEASNIENPSVRVLDAATGEAIVAVSSRQRTTADIRARWAFTQARLGWRSAPRNGSYVPPEAIWGRRSGYASPHRRTDDVACSP